MRTKLQKFLAVCLVPILIVSLFVVTPQAKAQTDLGLTVDASILIDAETGKILYEQNADAPLGIASMTKMMTEYILLDAIAEGKVSWDQQYRVTEYTYKVSQDRLLSNVPLRADGTYSIQELYDAMVIYSANAATIAIAETIAGSETEFLKLMNKKAEEIGLTDYKFVNSSGLNNANLYGMHPKGTEATDENIMPATSVAKLAYHLLKDHPEVLETAKIAKKTFREGTDDAIEMSNWNFMLPGLVYEYEGVDGLKTGTTDYAGHSFTGTAKRGDKRLIAVVMKAVDSKGVGSYKARFDATAKLFDFGFAQFDTVEVLPANYVFDEQKTIAVTKGKAESVNIGTTEAVSFMMNTNEKESYKPKLVLNETELEADIKAGTVVGKVVFEREGAEDYGFIDGKTIEVDVVTLEDVERKGGISLFFGSIGSFVGGLWNKFF